MMSLLNIFVKINSDSGVGSLTFLYFLENHVKEHNICLLFTSNKLYVKHVTVVYSGGDSTTLLLN
jgi:hypothetical protein